MLSLLIFRAASKEVVDKPPVTYGTPYTWTKSNSYTATTSNLETVLRNTGLLSADQITKTVKKMKFSSSSSTIENSFEMTINPYSTSSRTATKRSTVMKITKSGSNLNIKMGTAYVQLPVYSKVITTSSKTFLWWEWDKKTTIQWRPLTATELTGVHNKVDIYMDPLVATLK